MPTTALPAGIVTVKNELAAGTAVKLATVKVILGNAVPTRTPLTARSVNTTGGTIGQQGLQIGLQGLHLGLQRRGLHEQEQEILG